MDETSAAPDSPGTSPPVSSQESPRAESRGRSPRWRVAGNVAVALLAAGALAVGSLALTSRQPARTVVRHHSKPVLASAESSNLQPGAMISVTGSGTVQGKPDEVSFTIGVHTTSYTATGALNTNNGQVQSLETTLEQHGVQSKDMQTSSLYVYDNTNDAGEITGFSVDDDLNVNMTDLNSAGSAIDAAAQAVGNGIELDGISFSISNESALLAKARAAAMLNARTEADQVASGAGLTLGPVVKITDQENAGSQYFYGNGAAYASYAAPDALTLEAGRQPISVQVSVEYQLKA